MYLTNFLYIPQKNYSTNSGGKKIIRMSYYNQYTRHPHFAKGKQSHKSRGFRAHAYPFKCPDNTNANESLVNESK